MIAITYIEPLRANKSCPAAARRIKSLCSSPSLAENHHLPWWNWAIETLQRFAYPKPRPTRLIENSGLIKLPSLQRQLALDVHPF
jgi:hypothetical protein